VVNHDIQRHKKQAFLAAYSQCGNITRAAEMAEIDRGTHYVWLKDDPEYPALFEAATQEAGDRLEQEARRRAVEGVAEPVFYQGEICGTVQRYSDTLLIFLLKGAKPEKYADRAINENINKGDSTLTVVFAQPEKQGGANA
jgi:hypothetical protein